MLRISLTTGVLVLVGLTSSFEYGGYPGCFNPYVPPSIVPSPPLGPTLGPVPPPIGITAPTGFGVGPPPVPFTPSPFGCRPSPYGYGYGYPYGYPGYANCGSCGNGVLCGGCGACGTCGGGCNCGFPNGNCGGSCPFSNCGCGNCGLNSFGSCSACNSCPIPNTYIPGYFLEDPTSSQKYLVPPVLIAGAGCCNSFCGTGGACNSITDGVQTTGSCGATTVSVSETGDSTTVDAGTGDQTVAVTVDATESTADTGSDIITDATVGTVPDISGNAASLTPSDTDASGGIRVLGLNLNDEDARIGVDFLETTGSKTVALDTDGDGTSLVEFRSALLPDNIVLGNSDINFLDPTSFDFPNIDITMEKLAEMIDQQMAAAMADSMDSDASPGSEAATS